MITQTYDIAEEIVELLMDAADNEERRQIFQALALLFCSSCGRMETSASVVRKMVVGNCVHEKPRTLPNGIMERQAFLEDEDKHLKNATLLLRSRYSE